MKTIQLLLPAAFVFVLLVDHLAFPKRARRAWWMMATVFAIAGIFALFPQPLSRVAEILGVGRAVDVVIYIGLAVLVREFFLSRIRDRELRREITTITREIALFRAVAWDPALIAIDRMPKTRET